MKRPWMTTGVLAAAMTIGTSAYAQQTQGTKPATQGKSGYAGQQGGQNEKQFVQKMLFSNMAEIQLGQLGAERATNPEVKSFAQTMVKEHTQANEELLPIAKQLDVQQPSELDSKHKTVVARLSKLQGAEFDREFMNAMVVSHRETVRDAGPMAGSTGSGSKAGASTPSGSGAATGSGSASGSGAGSSTAGSQAVGTGGSAATQAVRQYAAKTVPIVKQHLQHAQQLQKSLAK